MDKRAKQAYKRTDRTKDRGDLRKTTPVAVADSINDAVPFADRGDSVIAQKPNGLKITEFDSKGASKRSKFKGTPTAGNENNIEMVFQEQVASNLDIRRLIGERATMKRIANLGDQGAEDLDSCNEINMKKEGARNGMPVRFDAIVNKKNDGPQVKSDRTVNRSRKLLPEPKIRNPKTIQETPKEAKTAETTAKKPDRELSNRKLDKESMYRKPDRESSNKILDKESTHIKPNMESSNRILVKELIDRQSDSETIHRKLDKETTNRQLGRESSNRKLDKESSNRKLDRESSNRKLDKESFNRKPDRELSNKILEKESTNRKPDRESSNRILAKESINRKPDRELSNKILVKEPTKSKPDRESSNKILDKESTNIKSTKELSNNKLDKESFNRKPIIKTVTSKTTSNSFKAVTFGSFREPKTQPKPIQINIPNDMTPSRKNPKSTNTVTSKLEIRARKEKPVIRRQIFRKRIRKSGHDSPDSCKFRENKSPPTEVAKWAPCCVNRHTKPYYEAWVNTTLAAISRSSKKDKLFMEKRSIIQSFQRALEERAESPELIYEKLKDERYTGRIRVISRHR